MENVNKVSLNIIDLFSSSYGNGSAGERIVSIDSATTPLGVTWKNSQGETVTGTLVASEDIKDNTYYVPSPTAKNKDRFVEYNVVLKDDVYDWERLGHEITLKERPYISLERLREYLYRVTFDSVPQDNGGSGFVAGACSSYVKDGKLYRNLDFKYDNAASFIVRTKDFEGMSFTTGLNDGELDADLVGQLPYHVVDGINKYGIKVSTHILFNDWQYTGAGAKAVDLTRLPYLVLTNVKSMETLETDLAGVLGNLKVPASMGEYLIQVLVTDGEATNVILPPNEDGDPYDIRDISGNARLTNFRWIDRETVERSDSSLQTRPTGIERFNAMPCALEDLRFTKAYESPDRLSEFIGINGTTKDSTDEELEAVYELARAKYLTRSRNGETWQTMHSVVYGDKMEELYIQEDWSDNILAGVSASGDDTIVIPLIEDESGGLVADLTTEEVIAVYNKLAASPTARVVLSVGSSYRFSSSAIVRIYSNALVVIASAIGSADGSEFFQEGITWVVTSNGTNAGVQYAEDAKSMIFGHLDEGDFYEGESETPVTPSEDRLYVDKIQSVPYIWNETDGFKAIGGGGGSEDITLCDIDDDLAEAILRWPLHKDGIVAVIAAYPSLKAGLMAHTELAPYYVNAKAVIDENEGLENSIAAHPILAKIVVENEGLAPILVENTGLDALVAATPTVAPTIVAYPAIAPYCTSYPAIVKSLARWSALAPALLAEPRYIPFLAEDNIIAHSIIDTGMRAWLVGDGTAYINTGLIQTSWPLVIDTRVAYDSTGERSFGGNYTNTGCIIGMTNNKHRAWSKNDYQPINTAIVQKQEYAVKAEYLDAVGRKLTVDGAVNENTTIQNGMAANTMPFGLFSRKGNTADTTMKGMLAAVDLTIGETTYHYVPAMQGGKYGYLETTTFEFKGNNNTSGSFGATTTVKE